MNIVIINKSDIIGGAAVVSYRLTNALCDAGADAKMLVMEQSGDDHAVVSSFGNSKLGKYYFIKERLKIFFANGFSRKNLFKVSIANSGFDISKHPLVQNADIIVLNWINQGALSIRGIEKLVELDKPIVWTMHDMWECTGICHHAYDCNGYKTDCGACGYLKSKGHRDLSYYVLQQKVYLYRNSNIKFVAVSNWLAERCRESSLLERGDIRVIHNAFPIEKYDYRRISNGSLQLATDKTVIIMGAARLDDPIKGFEYMIDAMNYIAKHSPSFASKIHLVLFGNIRNVKLLDEIKIPYTYVGNVKSESEVAALYAQSDIVVSTSLYETLSGTLIEGEAAGCVPVTFGNGGQRDIITHLDTGYIAQYKSAKSIAEGIEWASQAHIDRERLHNEVLNKFSATKIAQQYIALFDELLNSKA
ncbi:MAG: glycosyltransferase [Muribaculaceae bacterium]